MCMSVRYQSHLLRYMSTQAVKILALQVFPSPPKKRVEINNKQNMDKEKCKTG